MNISRFKEHEVEQDEPVCKMVTERKCNDVRGKKSGLFYFLYRHYLIHFSYMHFLVNTIFLI